MKGCDFMPRPRKEIDKKQFENLCAMQCTEDEICDWFGVSADTTPGLSLLRR